MTPGYWGQPLQVVPCHAELRGGWFQGRQLLQLFINHSLGFLWGSGFEFCKFLLKPVPDKMTCSACQRVAKGIARHPNRIMYRSHIPSGPMKQANEETTIISYACWLFAGNLWAIVTPTDFKHLPWINHLKHCSCCCISIDIIFEKRKSIVTQYVFQFAQRAQANLQISTSLEFVPINEIFERCGSNTLDRILKVEQVPLIFSQSWPRLGMDFSPSLGA